VCACACECVTCACVCVCVCACVCVRVHVRVCQYAVIILPPSMSPPLCIHVCQSILEPIISLSRPPSLSLSQTLFVCVSLSLSLGPCLGLGLSLPVSRFVSLYVADSVSLSSCWQEVSGLAQLCNCAVTHSYGIAA